MLNDPAGPLYFGIMCIAGIVLVSLYFWYNGWVDLRVNLRRLFCCGDGSSSEGDTHGHRTASSYRSIDFGQVDTKFVNGIHGNQGNQGNGVKNGVNQTNHSER